MKRLIYFFILIPVRLSAQEDDYNFKNAGDYNNFIMKEMTATVRKNFEYISFSVHSEEYDQLEAKRSDVVREINKSKESIRKMPPLEGDTRLRDVSVEVLEEYKNAFELDYKSIIGLKRKSKDSYESMEIYFEAQDKAEEKVNKATEKLRKAQHVYAEKNNMKVVDTKSDDSLEVKMKRVVAVNNYWRGIFLDYFKVSKEYDMLWDILPQQKASAISRQREQVLKTIDQIVPKLKALPDFNKDVEYRDQTIAIVEYYRKAASEDFQRIIEVLGKKSLQQKDVDEINGIINKCNADHERLTYNWNLASQDLFRKNVDKE
jgi:hypothetical protein